MTELYIKPEYLKMLKDVFNNYCPKAEIWAYGSRVKINLTTVVILIWL